MRTALRGAVAAALALALAPAGVTAERLQDYQLPGPAVLPPRIGSTVLLATPARNVWVRLRCPATAAGLCAGTLRLESGTLVLAHRSFTSPADRYTEIRMRLSRTAYRKLVRRGQLRASVVLLTRGADGNLRRAARRLTVLPPRRR